MTERHWLQHLEHLDAQEFAAAVARPTATEERALRNYLGPACLDRLRILASGMRRGSRGANVVVLHGIMGGELTLYRTPADPEPLWLKALSLIRGRFDRLPLNADGTSVHQVEATGILKRYYGEQLLTLVKEGWKVHAHWYDWRMDIRRSADILANRITEWFGDAPVHLVAHSMGGLVARAFIHRHPEIWARMWDRDGNGSGGGRLVMLGTPNYGSLAIPQMLFGLYPTLKKLAMIDVHHNSRELLDVVSTFNGALQMLPSPESLPGAEVLFRAETYAPLRVDQASLDAAHAFQRELATDPSTFDPSRTIYIAGSGQPTYTGIRNWSGLGSLDAYEAARAGDGTVPHALGLLPGVRTFYAESEHGALPCHEDVLRTLTEILETGGTPLLDTAPVGTGRGDDDAQSALELRWERDAAATAQAAASLNSATLSTADSESSVELADAEATIENLLARDFAGADRVDPAVLPHPPAAGVSRMDSTDAAASISIRLSSARIQNLDTIDDPAVDAIAVGHYIGTRPAGAELALDNAISGAGGGAGLLRSFADRGIVRGALGQHFFLADPRRPERVLVIAGMGYPGRFGMPELSAAARDLAWSVARLGKRHLAAVLIGSGDGNLTVTDAVRGWVEGLRQAFSDPRSPKLDAITFLEPRPAKLLCIQRALMAEAGRSSGSLLELDMRTLDENTLLEAAREDAVARAKAYVPELVDDRDAQARSAHATRLTVELEGGVYRYGAITETAAVAERRTILDPDLVDEANDALAAADDPATQAQLGQYLLRLLLPSDLRKQLASAHPLVVICDPAAARVHWEAIAQPETAGIPGIGEAAFLGIHRGLTRQLRTPFAPAPEPEPGPGRMLRVLIVADTSATEPLPGARREGERVRDLFLEIRKQELAKPLEKRSVAGVDVTALIGPADATRARVMRELLLNQYDVLHFAGHCVYDRESPWASGWVFSGGKRLGAQELDRLDGLPRFVFSNACESGVTPDRSGQHTAALAPGFAESFFARGVHNFVCTGWPVDDEAALDFAETFYTRLLGLRGSAPEPMHVAIRDARTSIFHTSAGRRSWGAYQHYGDPYAWLVGVPETVPAVAVAIASHNRA